VPRGFEERNVGVPQNLKRFPVAEKNARK